jgi:large repetitive protein
MKKHFTDLLKAIPLLAFILAFSLADAQINFAPLATEDFSLTVQNLSQTATNKLEFDVYLLDTDPAQDMELATIQFGWLFNSLCYTGGTVTAVINNTGSGLSTAQQFAAAPSIVATLAGYPNQTLLRLAGRTPPGSGNGTIISKVAPGTLLTHFVLTSTVPWTTNSTPNFVFNSNTATNPLYATRVNTYIANVNTPLAVVPGTNALICCNPILNPPGPPTAYNVTGGGSYCQGLTGLPVGLDNSEAGVTYTLYKGAVAQVPTVPGTGAAITFGNQLAGTYTVKGTNGTGTTDMTGSAIITENPSLPVSVSIAPDANSICAGVPVTFTATPVNEGLTPTYQWYVNNVLVVGALPTYTYTPANNDVVKVVLTSSLAGCLSTNPATSNIVTMIVFPAGPATVSIASSANPSCGSASVTFTATPGNGGIPTYQWFVNSLPVGASLPTYSYVPTTGDVVTVQMTSSLACATGSPVTSAPITQVVTPAVPASVSIAASTNPICQYTPVTFTATPVNGGTPTYQWYSNSLPVGTGMPTFTNVDPINNDQVYVVMTSSLCSTGSPATSSTITMVVYPAPAPSISGPANVCVNVPGNVYTTEPGMSNYTWTHGTGIVTAGGTPTDNTITITWPTAGLQTLSINYSNANLCRASNPNLYSPTVYALPVPTITGPVTPVGVGTTQVYTTEAGMTGYSWTVSAGGSFVGPTTGNSVSVLWNIAGPQTVSVNYLNANLCTAVAPVAFPVTVVSIPPPAGAIAGTTPVCQGATGATFSVAPIPNATGYVWTLPAGATIATGANTNSITVNFSFTAVSGNVTVYGTNTFGNGAPSPNYPIVVNPAAVPTITGPASPCPSTSVVYTTQPGMTNYLWTVSAGGLITAGGTPTSNTVTVTWSVVGAQSVSVNYNNANGCTAAVPTVYTVNVLTTATPTLTGPADACTDGGTVIYYTQGGQSNYQWVVSPGGTVIAGGTSMTQSVTVQWNVIGAQTVSVNYNNAGGCPATVPAVLNVNVSMTPGAAGAINGPATVCAGATSIGYDVAAIDNATSYVWTVPTGATIVDGDGTNAITVDFNDVAVSGSITVKGSNFCGFGATATKAIAVSPLPVAGGTILGETTVCQGELAVVYTVDPIANATSYVWAIPAGANLISGAGTNSIVVDYSRIAESGEVSVYGVNDCGIGFVSSIEVTVKPIPETPVITFDEATLVLTSSAAEGNQWYMDGMMIDGATAQTYQVLEPGTYYVVVIVDGCPSEPSNSIVFTGIGATASKGTFELFPVPNNGVFTATMVWPSAEMFKIQVYNNIGSLVFEQKDILVNGLTKQVVDLRPVPSGMYTVIFTSGTNQIIRKVMVNRD